MACSRCGNGLGTCVCKSSAGPGMRWDNESPTGRSVSPPPPYQGLEPRAPEFYTRPAKPTTPEPTLRELEARIAKLEARLGNWTDPKQDDAGVRR